MRGAMPPLLRPRIQPIACTPFRFYRLEIEMTSNNRMILALGVAGLALLSIFGKSRKMTRKSDEKETAKDLTSWEGEGGSPTSKAGAASMPPLSSPTSH